MVQIASAPAGQPPSLRSRTSCSRGRRRRPGRAQAWGLKGQKEGLGLEQVLHPQGIVALARSGRCKYPGKARELPLSEVSRCLGGAMRRMG